MHFVCTCRYGFSYTSLQPRITKTLIHAFLDFKMPRTTHYGAIVGLTELGPQIVQVLLLPHLKNYVSGLDEEIASQDPIVQLEARKCKEALLVCASCLGFALLTLS